MSVFKTALPVLVLLLLHIAGTLAKTPVVVGYYPTWKRQAITAADTTKYTHVNVAFAIPKADGSLTFDGDWFMDSIVKDFHANNAKVLISVGGWTGSNFFSQIIKSDDGLNRLVNSMTDYVSKYNLDGIDIDWEYPGRIGNTCNVFDPANDAPNYLKLLQALRSRLDSSFGSHKKLITLAVRVQPFDGPNGPLSDVSEFAKVVDFANLMQYDLNGPWNPETGPNAPFNFEQGRSAPFSFVTAIDAWTNAGWPANKLNAGLGFYGRSTKATVDMSQDPNNQYQAQSHDVPLGDSEDGPWYDACAGSTSNSGTWQWKHLRDQGVLESPSVASSPWVRQWDNISKTPWLFNAQSRIYLSFDDPDSINIKSSYAAERGLLGVMVWHMAMDHNSELVDAAIQAWPGNRGKDDNSPPPSAQGSASSARAPLSTSSNANKPNETSGTSVSPTPSPASSESSPPPPNKQLIPGNSCNPNGNYQCIDGGGRNSAYVVCHNEKWLARSCAPGTVCLGLGRSILCGWPVFARFVTTANKFAHGLSTRLTDIHANVASI